MYTTNRDNGVKAIENLMKKKGRFDYILLETTGLADPGILMFFSSLTCICCNFFVSQFRSDSFTFLA